MIALIADHLWQSTLFALAAALVCFAHRRNRAQTRYLLWLATSIKFLVPFGALVALGGWSEWRPSVPVPPFELVTTLETLSQPFTGAAPMTVATPLPASTAVVSGSGLLMGAWALGTLAMLALWSVRWRRVAGIVATARPIVDGREFEHLRHLERAMNRKRPLAILSTSSWMEPAVFGIFRPVLVWPSKIDGRLSDSQSAAIIAHEVAHVRRRDNLWAAIHQLVQSLFWFHPLLWWLSARLIDERERACDEEVVRLGSQPAVYAESLLRTCEFCVDSSPVCAAGVTGSDLKRRIERIMRNEAGVTLTAWRRFGLAAAACAAIALPLAIGAILSAPVLRAQSQAITEATPRFDAASIKRNTGGAIASVGSRILPDGSFTATNLTLRQLIRLFYQLQDAQLIGAPSWIDDERYDIQARPAQRVTTDQARMMGRALLADRFTLRSHPETRVLPVYALVHARADRRLGPGLKETPPEECAKQPEFDGRGPLPCGVIQFGAGQLNSRATTMESLAGTLMNGGSFTGIDRIVVDRTGLTGNYGFQLRFQAVGRGGGPPVNDSGQPSERPSLFTALQEELGLKLDPQRAPIEVLVIDSIDRPTEN